MVLDPAGVHEEAGLGRAPPFRRLTDQPLGDTGYLGGLGGVPGSHVLGNLVEANGELLDEGPVDPPLLDHQVEHAVEQGDVTPRFDRQEQVAGAGQRCDPGIDDDDPRAVLAGLPDILGRDGSALGDVGPADPDELGLGNVAPRVRGPVDAERLLVPSPGAHHAQSAVVVDVGSLEAHPGELAHQVGLLDREARTAQHAHRRVAVGLLDATDLGGDACDRLLVAHRAETLGDRGVPLERREQPIRMSPLKVAFDTLRTKHASVEGKVVPRLEARDDVVLDLELNAALLTAEAAVRLDKPVWLGVGGQSHGAGTVQVRPEAVEDRQEV